MLSCGPAVVTMDEMHLTLSGAQVHRQYLADVNAGFDAHAKISLVRAHQVTYTHPGNNSGLSFHRSQQRLRDVVATVPAWLRPETIFAGAPGRRYL